MVYLQHKTLTFCSRYQIFALGNQSLDCFASPFELFFMSMQFLTKEWAIRKTVTKFERLKTHFVCLFRLLNIHNFTLNFDIPQETLQLIYIFAEIVMSMRIDWQLPKMVIFWDE